MFYTQYELKWQELAMAALDGLESIEFPVREVTTEGVTSAAIRIQEGMNMCLARLCPFLDSGHGQGMGYRHLVKTRYS